MDRYFYDWADELLRTERGVGMVPPFYAETASVKGDESWPAWIVRNKVCNSLGLLMSRDEAVALTEAMNAVVEQRAVTGPVA